MEDEIKQPDEVQETRAKYLRIIEQGQKLENLYAQEDFQFFLGWIEKLRDDLAAKILNGHLPVDKEDWHARGGYTYLNKVVQAAEQFATKAKRARKQLEKFDKALKEAED